jgi:hypothetical protein
MLVVQNAGRCFAALNITKSVFCHPERSEGSITERTVYQVRGAECGQMFRCAQHDKSVFCHPERSEGSINRAAGVPSAWADVSLRST